MTKKTKYEFGQPVFLKWGVSEVRGRIYNVYDYDWGMQLVIALEPEESGWIVDEPTTVTVPPDQIRLVDPAA